MEGGSLPEKTVPWQQAVDLVGDAALREAGTSARGHASAYGNWKNQRGVPWYIIGPLLLAKLRLEQTSQGTKGSSAKPALREVQNMPAPLREARDDLARIYFHYKPDSEEWQAILRMIRLIAPREHAPAGAETEQGKVARRRPR